MQGSSLQEIANTFGKPVGTSSAVSMSSPVLPGIGRLPELINILGSFETDKLYDKIESNNAVFAVMVSKKELPATLTNYSNFAKTLAKNLQTRGDRAYEVLKKTADIEDNRAFFY